MTKDGKENRFGRFIFEDEQAERVAAGDYSAVWEFMKDNGHFIFCCARSFIFKRLLRFPSNFYDAQEYVQQIYVDFITYDLTGERSIVMGIYGSFYRLMYGGKHEIISRISLDAPARIYARNGDQEEGATLGELLPSCDPLPFDVIANLEHVKKIAPRIFLQLADVFQIDLHHMNEGNGATIGDIIRVKQGRKSSLEEFREVVEEIFHGMTFEEVAAYAQSKTA